MGGGLEPFEMQILSGIWRAFKTENYYFFFFFSFFFFFFFFFFALQPI
jgi:hypothetical protein